MIYHAQIARIADQQDLERFQENHISTSALKKSVLGQAIETNINFAADLLRHNAAQRGGFIKALAEFYSPECAQVILSMNSKGSTRGYPIRESPNHCLFPAPRSVSSVSTPFIVFECLGIHRKPFYL